DAAAQPTHLRTGRPDGQRADGILVDPRPAGRGARVVTRDGLAHVDGTDGGTRRHDPHGMPDHRSRSHLPSRPSTTGARWQSPGIACDTVTEKTREQTEIDRLAEEHLDAMVAMSPMMATYLGVSGQDDKLDDLSIENYRAEREL